MSEPTRLTFDSGTLILHGEPPGELPEEFQDDPRIGHARAPGVAYREALAWLHRSGEPYVDEARQYNELELHHIARREPFSHQAEALEAWVAAGKRGTVVLPTGAGKTYVAELAIFAAQRSALVVVPTLELMSQWYDRLSTAFGEAVGLVGGGHHVIEDITITTYDSAYIHLEKLGNRFGLLIFDEVHHLPGPSYALAAEGSIAPFRLGLTATPERPDGGEASLVPLVGPIVYRREITELEGDILAEYRVERIEVEMSEAEQARHDAERAIYRNFISSRGIRMGGRNGWQNFLRASSRSAQGRRAFLAYREQKAIAQSPEAKFFALEAILREHWGDRVLIFTNDNATAYRISRQMLIPAITHRTDAVERREILEKFREGTLRAIATSRVLNEGVDVPDARVGIVVSGTGSVREHVQRLGRILRRAENKQAVLYEIVTAGTSEEGTSRRRRSHSAYR